MVADALLLACLAATLFMTGLIWFVQVVHYPLFARVEAAAFGAYHQAHTSRTTLVVAVPMLVELATSVALVARRPVGVGPGLAWLGLLAAVASWASTALVQVPSHTRLAAGFDAGTALWLVRSNWFRVATWTGHAGVVLAMTAARFSA